ncbi:tyrosine-type recombinase/integrase [Desulfoscipio gibsoniae]
MGICGSYEYYLIDFVGDRRDDKPLFGITSHAFKWWARKCRLKTGVDFHSHRCRHTTGTQLLQKGISIDKVQDVLGHADISTTRRYAKTAPEAIYELAAKVDEIKERRVLYRFWLR